MIKQCFVEKLYDFVEKYRVPCYFVFGYTLEIGNCSVPIKWAGKNVNSALYFMVRIVFMRQDRQHDIRLGIITVFLNKPIK